MQHLANPVETMAACVYAACGHDLPDLAFLHPYRPKAGQPQVERFRRPHPSEVEVRMFPQLWGSTALGFGGGRLGGAAMTHAYTVVVTGPEIGSAVYFGSGLAYTIPTCVTETQAARLRADIAQGQLANADAALAAYGALLPMGGEHWISLDDELPDATPNRRILASMGAVDGRECQPQTYLVSEVRRWRLDDDPIPGCLWREIPAGWRRSALPDTASAIAPDRREGQDA